MKLQSLILASVLLMAGISQASAPVLYIDRLALKVDTTQYQKIVFRDAWFDEVFAIQDGKIIADHEDITSDDRKMAQMFKRFLKSQYGLQVKTAQKELRPNVPAILGYGYKSNLQADGSRKLQWVDRGTVTLRLH